MEGGKTDDFKSFGILFQLSRSHYKLQHYSNNFLKENKNQGGVEHLQAQDTELSDTEHTHTHHPYWTHRVANSSKQNPLLTSCKHFFSAIC